MARPGRKPLDTVEARHRLADAGGEHQREGAVLAERARRSRGRGGCCRGRPTRTPAVHCSSVIAVEPSRRRSADTDQRTVEASPPVLRGRDQPARGSRIRVVGGHADRPVLPQHAQRGDRRVDVLLRAARHDHPCSFGCQRLCGGAAETPRAARDDEDAVMEIEVHGARLGRTVTAMPRRLSTGRASVSGVALVLALLISLLPAVLVGPPAHAAGGTLSGTLTWPTRSRRRPGRLLPGRHLPGRTAPTRGRTRSLRHHHHGEHGPSHGRVRDPAASRHLPCLLREAQLRR